MTHFDLDPLLRRLPGRTARRALTLAAAGVIACLGDPGAHAVTAPLAPVPAASASIAAPPPADDFVVTAPASPPEPLAEPAPEPVVVAKPAPSSLVRRTAARLGELEDFVRARKASLGYAVADLASGAELASSGADRPLNPASNQKLLTAAVALSRLGATFRYHTGVYGRIDGGVAERLVVRSDGDPTFSYRELVGFAERLVALGLKKVTLGVLVDQSAFDELYTPPAYEQQPREWAAFRAPVSAVSLDRNTTTLHVAPAEAGEDARVEFEPPGFVTVRGRVETKKEKRSPRVGLTLRPSGFGLEAEVSGSISAGSPAYHYTRRIENPAVYAGVVLARELRALGVEVANEVAVGGKEETAELVGRDSVPLRELLPQLGKSSDNFYAETVLKTIGARVLGAPGTSAGGARVVSEWLRDRHIASAGVEIQNGSGLYDANRVTARVLTRTLTAALSDPAISRDFVEQLAVGGVDGTLRGRFRGLREERSVRAKTGTLNEVTALSGYVFGPKQQSGVAFSILVTGTADHAGARQRIDALVEALAAALQSSDAVALAVARRD